MLSIHHALDTWTTRAGNKDCEAEIWKETSEDGQHSVETAR